jgi:predicted transcriptional regulator
MSANQESVRLSLALSPELNARLEELAQAGHTSKSEILRKAIALFDVVVEAKSEKKRFGIFDQDKHLLTEIVGI